MVTGELEQLFRQKLNINAAALCGRSHGEKTERRLNVLFQLRQYRTVQNAGVTKLALQRSLNATVVMQQFETISIRRQIELVTCADVLIGVSGAGLTYHRFLTPGAIM